MQDYIGFYWTLPVHWAGFHSLPGEQDVDAAARASRTIRYQRELVRAEVRERKGRLVQEIATIGLRPDRATDEDFAALSGAVDRAGTATVMAVAFHEEGNWRAGGRYLSEVAYRLGFEIERLRPDPIAIDGVMFDPVRHFRQWQQRDARGRMELRLRAIRGIRDALAEIPEGDGRYAAIATRLTQQGIRTVQDGEWKAENVRKMVKALAGR